MIKRSPKQEKTLSSLTILFLLYEKDLNGYSITQYIKKWHINNYFPLSETTIYKTVDKLEQQNFIESQKVQNANYPVSTLYKITPAGKLQYKLLMEDACTFNRNIDSLQVLLGFACFLSIDEQTNIAKKWQRDCSAYLKELDSSIQLSKINDEDLYGKAYAEWLLILNEESVLRNQVRWVKKYIKYLKNNDIDIK
jgi:DNA-binding PadR family transcriptional regulator